MLARGKHSSLFLCNIYAKEKLFVAKTAGFRNKLGHLFESRIPSKTPTIKDLKRHDEENEGQML